MYTWTEQRIEWFCTSSEYTGFHKKLADILSPIIGGGDILDIGCGLGLVDIELSRTHSQITALDVSAEAIAHLGNTCSSMGIENVKAVCGGAQNYKAKSDVVLMNFFEHKNMDFKHYLSLCNHKLIRVVNQKNVGAFCPRKYWSHRRDDIGTVTAELDALCPGYDLLQVDLEFGQLLASYEDACVFVTSHAPGIEDEDLHEFLAERLEKTQRPGYPLYFPNMKHLCIFTARPNGS